MRVDFLPLGCSVEIHKDETLLDAARRAAAPLGNACGGIGVCARCRVRITRGAEHLSPPTAIESRVAASRAFAPTERLACQAVVKGDCEMTTDYW